MAVRSKAKNKAAVRRMVRRREKSSDISRDSTMGKVCRRGYGRGIVK